MTHDLRCVCVLCGRTYETRESTVLYAVPISHGICPCCDDAAEIAAIQEDAA